MAGIKCFPTDRKPANAIGKSMDCPAQYDAGAWLTPTGSDLLAEVKELGDASKSDLVRSCGYVSTKKDGDERLNFTAFYEALLEAKGVSWVQAAARVRVHRAASSAMAGG
jgi:hypothetical protein